MYCDEPKGFFRGLSLRLRLRPSLRLYFIVFPDFLYRHSQLQTQHWPSWEINIGRVDSPYCSDSWAIREILLSRLSNTGGLNFNIIIKAIENAQYQEQLIAKLKYIKGGCSAAGCTHEMFCSFMDTLDVPLVPGEEEVLIFYCICYDERKDIRWNIAWARGKSRGRSPRDF